ncbi:PhnE/PtxC family ABC transporter permease [Conservatibacter flavescens]|uniref:Phosphonate ABC transporter permease n=1 Tax=Conservatibacter flavescens TaxID=28161 RepID=A0A2M8S5A4_9PAST|nr:ABC transporter permease subunit [Conservatibacter flavescens]PJG86325.1 phosphonate ABC transporter permease [Conservatibacter flavescens]
MKTSLNERRHILTLILLLVFLFSLFAIDHEKGIMHSGGWATLQRLFTSLLQPDFSPALLKLAFKSSLLTFAYALLTISLALISGFILAIFASGVLFPSKLLQTTARAILGFLRAIHELIWAWFFVAAVGLNPIGAIFSLAIPYSGYLGKIFADTLQTVSYKPIATLTENGATPLQLLIYGYLPQAFPMMLSYTMYRLECAIRSSSVLSFVGLGGIGMQIQLSLQDLRYDQVWTFLIFLVAMIIFIDRWSYAVRKRVK